VTGVQTCALPISTTLATIEGVTLYRGRACQGYAGPWDLVDFAPAAPSPAG
jgi:hypothetical protein